jgi:hypothetical protein
MFKSWGFNTMQQRRPVRRALLSVSDKAGIVEFAQALSARGVELLSTAAPLACWQIKACRLPKSLTTPVSRK